MKNTAWSLRRSCHTCVLRKLLTHLAWWMVRTVIFIEVHVVYLLTIPLCL